jgi:hypothetical protein
MFEWISTSTFIQMKILHPFILWSYDCDSQLIYCLLIFARLLSDRVYIEFIYLNKF